MKRPVPVLRDRSGASIVEVMMAMVILGIGLVGLAVVFPASSIAVTDGGFLTSANGLAMEPIERAKRETYHSATANLKSTFDTAYGNWTFQDLTGEGFPGFSRRVQVTEFNGGGSGCAATGSWPYDCSLVTVEVTTPGGLGTTLRSVVTQR
jgi:type II secretory pathway pseudopilin PulG